MSDFKSRLAANNKDNLIPRIEAANKILNELANKVESIVYNYELYLKQNKELSDVDYEELKGSIGILKEISYDLLNGSERFEKEVPLIKQYMK